MTSKISKDHWIIILTIVSVLMGIEIVYITIQNQKLKSILNDPKRYFNTLTKEDVVPSITAVDINGEEINLRYSLEAPPTLLFWFSPGCSVCEGNFEFWNRIFMESDEEHIRCLGMCIGTPEEAKDFCDENGLAFPVICVSDAYILESYKGNVIPQTVLISPTGTVLGAWPGLLEKEQEGKILSFAIQP